MVKITGKSKIEGGKVRLIWHGMTPV